MTKLKIVQVKPEALHYLPTKNPNVMDPHIFSSLEKSIQTDGFLQPILVVKEGSKYIVIDGVHRSQAASNVGLATIPAVVAPDRERAELLRISLNKMRGEIDISEVGRQLQLLLDTGLSRDDLELTGFEAWEIETMLDGLGIDETDLAGAVTAAPEPERPKTYALNFKFDTESERVRVRETLEKVGDGDALAGLWMLVNEQNDQE